MENIKTVNDLRGTVWKISDSFNLEIAGNTTHLNTSDINDTQSYIKLINENYQDERYEIDISPCKDGTGWEDLLIGLDWTGRSGIATTETYYFTGVIQGSTLYFSPNLPENYLVDGGGFLQWLKQYGTLIDTVKPTLSSLFKDITNALREKQGTTEPIKHLDIASKIRNLSVGGGVEINGNVETYECIEPIVAGDFVEIVNNVNKELAGRNIAMSCTVSSILLEPNKIFMTYRSSNSYYLNASIVELDGLNMTITTTQLNSNSNSCYMSPNCILLESNKVFIVHSYSGSKHLYCTIVEINGTEMTATTTALYEVSNALYNGDTSIPNCILLEPNKVFIGFSSDRYEYLYGAIVEINGTTATATITQLNTTTYSCYMCNPAGVLLEPNKVLLVHDYKTGNYTGATIVEINGTEMTATTTEIANSYGECSCTPGIIKLDNNKVFVALKSGSYSTLTSRILEVNDTTVSSINYKTLLGNYSSYTNPFSVLLDDGTIFIIHSNTSDRHLYGTTVTIDNDTITAGTTIPLNTERYSNGYGATCVQLDGGKIFIPHIYTTSLYLYGTIYLGGDRAKYASTTINGVAKTSGNIGEEIQVYVPKGEE